MTFFNKKEEVLDVQLTAEGRRQLAMGRLKPSYYAFYDDDVLYDVAYASSTETQNQSQPRILDNTIYPKTNARFKGTAEKGHGNYNKNDVKNEENLEIDIHLKESPFFTSLGTYDSMTQAAPYFEVHLLSDNISPLATGSSTGPVLFARVSSSGEQGSRFTTSGGTVANLIPQLHITASYKYFYDTSTNRTYVREDPLLLEIVERNTQFGNFVDNFDIQVSEITGSKIMQPRLFIVEDKSPKTPQEQTDYQLKLQKIKNDLENLVVDSLEILLDEETKPLFPPELFSKKALAGKPTQKVDCEDQK